MGFPWILLNKGRLLTIGGAILLAGLIIWIKILGAKLDTARAERDACQLRLANAVKNLEVARHAIDEQNAAITTLHEEGKRARQRAKTALEQAAQENSRTEHIRTELVRESREIPTVSNPLTNSQLAAWEELK